MNSRVKLQGTLKNLHYFFTKLFQYWFELDAGCYKPLKEMLKELMILMENKVNPFLPTLRQYYAR